MDLGCFILILLSALSCSSITAENKSTKHSIEVPIRAWVNSTKFHVGKIKKNLKEVNPPFLHKKFIRYDRNHFSKNYEDICFPHNLEVICNLQETILDGFDKGSSYSKLTSLENIKEVDIVVNGIVKRPDIFANLGIARYAKENNYTYVMPVYTWTTKVNCREATKTYYQEGSMSAAGDFNSTTTESSLSGTCDYLNSYRFLVFNDYSDILNGLFTSSVYVADEIIPYHHIYWSADSQSLSYTESLNMAKVSPGLSRGPVIIQAYKTYYQSQKLYNELNGMLKEAIASGNPYNVIYQSTDLSVSTKENFLERLEE